ncbi:MAG: tRNA pseudouridine(38-40) synthase TruA [Lachnospiraceae bacterium]|nr:tRNA pseudouridine(38-40) synthase TruA [Lachnospiraceae bacterium]
MRVLIRVAYDGTDFAGWQKQPGRRTVEGELLKALGELFPNQKSILDDRGGASAEGRKGTSARNIGSDPKKAGDHAEASEKQDSNLDASIELIGGSRTDAGVHSYGNPAVFDVETRMPAERIAPALNVRLPEDIRVMSSIAVAEDFHPHHVKSRKTYEYRIRVARTLFPTDRYYFHTVHVPLNVEQMQKAADCLVGKHDFTSFSSVHAQVKSRVRTIYELSVSREIRYLPGNGPASGMKAGDHQKSGGVPELQEMDVRIRVTGDGFLYNMVRIIAGTLIEVGRGAMSSSSVKEILEAKDRSLAGPTAPAKGLFLLGTEFLDFEEDQAAHCE